MGSNPIREHMGNEARLLNSLLCHLKIGIIGFISRGAKDAALYQNQTCTIVPRPFRIRKLVARKWLYQGSVMRGHTQKPDIYSACHTLDDSKNPGPK
jgi:hypothetical protein